MCKNFSFGCVLWSLRFRRSLVCLHTTVIFSVQPCNRGTCAQHVSCIVHDQMPIYILYLPLNARPIEFTKKKKKENEKHNNRETTTIKYVLTVFFYCLILFCSVIFLLLLHRGMHFMSCSIVKLHFHFAPSANFAKGRPF